MHQSNDLLYRRKLLFFLKRPQNNQLVKVSGTPLAGYLLLYSTTSKEMSSMVSNFTSTLSPISILFALVIPPVIIGTPASNFTPRLYKALARKTTALAGWFATSFPTPSSIFSTMI